MTTQLPPIRRQVIVPGTVETAFTVFTDEIGQWWPLGDAFSVYGEGTTVAFRDGRVVERGPAGDEALWGTVLDWQPPHRLRMTWHPSSDAATATEVEVSFAAVTDGQTLVTLEHRGWERLANGVAARTQYSQGWPLVLGGYVARTGKEAPVVAGGEPVWLALMHTPGPALPAGTSVFGHPDFAEHIGFLRRLDERGVLVAAGPLGDSGEGMTVIRVPDAAEVAAYAELAQADDQSVARELLQVRIQPWHVSLAGSATTP
jgi:uncharacterized protein YndB with AHSA1/START domain/uncharacterized protein YciI